MRCSRTGGTLQIGDKVVYVTTSYHVPTMRFGTITNIEHRKITIMDCYGKKRYTRGRLMYKLDEVNAIFNEGKHAVL